MLIMIMRLTTLRLKGTMMLRLIIMMEQMQAPMTVADIITAAMRNRRSVAGSAGLCL